jgi:hypothetical protein
MHAGNAHRGERTADPRQSLYPGEAGTRADGKTEQRASELSSLHINLLVARSTGAH